MERLLMFPGVFSFVIFLNINCQDKVGNQLRKRIVHLSIKCLANVIPCSQVELEVFNVLWQMSKFPTVISELSYAIFMSPNKITDIVVCIVRHINYRLTRNIIIILLRSITIIQISFLISFLDVSMINTK